MSQIVQYVRSRLPGGDANNALANMMAQDQKTAKKESESVGCFSRFCCCTGCSALLKLYETKFGFRECQDEVDMLTAGLTEQHRTQITTNALRIFRRRRICGDSNYLICCDPIAAGGTRLPTVSILRVRQTTSCQTSVRRICFDARHIVQVEMSDTWETTELWLELITFIFGLSAWGYVFGAEPQSDRQETMRNNVLVVLTVGLLALLFVILLNFINMRFFRATQLVVDTCMPGRAMVTSNRFFSDVGVHTENSATNTAQQYTVTLPQIFVMDARQILQHWKQIADNMTTPLNLAADTVAPCIAADADTRNLDLMVPSWARPVADVVVPPPGAAVQMAEEEPLIPGPPQDHHLQAAQVAAHVRLSQQNGAGAAHAQRRREQAPTPAEAYVPPE
eukprot:jgi/Ulvmu1/6267/UM028_0125.1